MFRQISTDGHTDRYAATDRQKNTQGDKQLNKQKIDKYMNRQAGRWKKTDSCEHHTAQENEKSVKFNMLITALISTTKLFLYK